MTTARGRYWLRDFPLHEFYQEYTHHGRFPLARRNLRFTIYTYVGSAEIKHTLARTFSDQTDLYHYLESVADRLITIEVGAIYPMAGFGHIIASNEFKPFGVYCKELVLDIDLSDYAKVRFCGCGADKKSCEACFALYLGATAIPVIRDALRERGWTNASLNYSGNRGVHVWIYEDSVMYYGTRERNDFLDFFERPPSELLRRWARDIYAPVWEQHYLGNTAEKLGPDVLAELERLMVECFRFILVLPPLGGVGQGVPAGIPGTTLRAKWQHLQTHYSPGQFEQCSERFLHKLLGPRLDRQVTADIHHLTKSPYSISSKTGYIAMGMKWTDVKPELRYVE